MFSATQRTEYDWQFYAESNTACKALNGSCFWPRGQMLGIVDQTKIFYNFFTVLTQNFCKRKVIPYQKPETHVKIWLLSSELLFGNYNYLVRSYNICITSQYDIIVSLVKLPRIVGFFFL